MVDTIRYPQMTELSEEETMTYAYTVRTNSTNLLKDDNENAIYQDISNSGEYCYVIFLSIAMCVLCFVKTHPKICKIAVKM